MASFFVACVFSYCGLATVSPDYGYILIEIVVCSGKVQCHNPVVALLLLFFVADVILDNCIGNHRLFRRCATNHFLLILYQVSAKYHKSHQNHLIG